MNVTLLKKELRLLMHPTNFLFLFLSFMVMIPNYPYYVIFFYAGLGIFFAVLGGRENQDITYTLLLPVKKRDVVKARFLFVAFIECLQAVTVLPIILLKNILPSEENLVGMEANLPLVGIGLLLFGVYNLVLFCEYYKNPQKVGVSFIKGTIVMGICMLIAEVLTHMLPVFRDCLDTMGGNYLGYKMVVLVLGIIGYLGLTFAAYQRSWRTFENIDL